MRTMRDWGTFRGLGLMLVALAMLVAGCGDDSAATTAAPTTSLAAPTTTVSVPGKTPAASAEELETRILAALTAGDAEALRGLLADGSWHRVYPVQGGAVSLAANVNLDTFQPWGGEAWEVLGGVMVAGKVAATPVQVTFAENPGTWVGFDVIVVEEVAGGFLGGTGLVLYAEVDSPDYVEADPAVVAGLLAAQAAAWAAGDIDGVLADYWETYAKYVDGFTNEAVSASRLADFYAGMQLEFTGEPVISGPFFAVATRVTDPASGAATDGVSVYWVREGEIALHILTTGT